MNAYHQAFFPIFVVGCVIAASASFVAAFLAERKSGCLFPLFSLGLGILAFWAALFLGSDFGYRAWQAIPDPPAEAFSDAAPMGALLLGWLPGGVFCSLVFGSVFTVFRVSRFLRREGEQDLANSVPEAKSVETGNPYRSPSS